MRVQEIARIGDQEASDVLRALIVQLGLNVTLKTCNLGLFEVLFHQSAPAREHLERMLSTHATLRSVATRANSASTNFREPPTTLFKCSKGLAKLEEGRGASLEFQVCWSFSQPVLCSDIDIDIDTPTHAATRPLDAAVAACAAAAAVFPSTINAASSCSPRSSIERRRWLSARLARPRALGALSWRLLAVCK